LIVVLTLDTRDSVIYQWRNVLSVNVY
jgi:hypothetical protein